MSSPSDLSSAPPALPRVSVIIPHFNTPELLVKCLQALATQQLDHGYFETIVVDNGSRLPLHSIQAAWPHVRFYTEKTPGPGPARNMGVQHARADILAFIDADVRVTKGWLQAGVENLGNDPLALIGGDVRIEVKDPNNLTNVEAFESVFSFQQKIYIQKSHYSVTANVMMRRAVFEKAGPFDGIDKPEDRAFGERAYNAGIQTRYAPEMRVYHPARADFTDLCKKYHRVDFQAFSRYQAQGRSSAYWTMRAMAMAVSWVPHAPKMFLSDRVSGLANRYRGFCMLVRLRWVRALDMLDMARKARAGDEMTLVNWNR